MKGRIVLIFFSVILIVVAGIVVTKNNSIRTFPEKKSHKKDFTRNFSFSGRDYNFILEDYIYDKKYYRFQISDANSKLLLYSDFESINDETYLPSRLLSKIKSYDGRARIILDNSDTLIAVPPAQGILKDSL